MRRACVVLACAGTLAGSAAMARPSITTLFANNNSGTAGGGVYFDITVGPNPIQIIGFDVNTTAVAGTALAFRAWTLVGTSVGNQANPGAWTFQTDGSGTSAGLNLPSSISIVTPFTLNAGTMYGMALSLSSATGAPAPASHAYTNGTGANQFYMNADLSLTLGSATNVLFSGAPFSPRVWNGTIYYNVIPAPASLALLGLAGLVAARRRR